MNYYERHIGDYAKDTGHLSMLEHGAYTLLIDRYYATEAPIPADQAHRMARARSKEEREAVDLVLSEFFQLGDDGAWHQKRCDEQIAEYKDGEPERLLKKENEQLRTKRHREERAKLFAELHAAGIHLPWNVPTAELRAVHGRACNGTGKAAVTALVTAATGPVTPPDTAPVTRPVTAPVTPVTAPATVTGPEPVTASATPVTATHSPLPISHSFQNPPYPPCKGGDDAHSRSGRKPRTATDASAIAWAVTCRAIDEVRGQRDKTWADADAVIADPKATAAAMAIGGHRVIAGRDKYTQGDLKRRFRERYEQSLELTPKPAPVGDAQPEGEARDIAELAAGALKAVAS